VARKRWSAKAAKAAGSVSPSANACYPILHKLAGDAIQIANQQDAQQKLGINGGTAVSL
jgi:carbamate kinase